MEDINLEIYDIAITSECNICFVNFVKSRKNILNCCMCHNFNMCVPCFLIYSDDPRKFGNGKVSCPYCRAPNGFAYWSVLDKYNKRENMWKTFVNIDFTNTIANIGNNNITNRVVWSDNDSPPPLEEAS